jgi:hypothetical protein
MSSFIENLLLKLRERRSSYSSRIVSGNIATLEEYRFAVGKNLGIEEAEEMAKALYKDMYERKMEE